MRNCAFVIRAAAIIALAATAGFSAAQSVFQATSEAAEIAAHQFEQSLRDNGLALRPDDRKAVDYLFRHKEAIVSLRKKLAESEQKAKAAGLTSEVKQLQKEKKALDAMWKELPSVPTIKEIKGNQPGFEQQLRAYTAQRAKGNEKRIEQSDKTITTVSNKIKKVATGEAGGGSSSGGSDPNRWVALMSVSGQMPDKPGSVEILVNGQIVSSPQQEIKIRKGETLKVRAVGIDARRSMIRGFTESAATSLVGESSDYGIKYKTSSGSFTGTSSFSMKAEEYNWSISISGDRDADYKLSDSRVKNGIQNDLAVFTFKTQFTATITITGSVSWASDSMRPAGRRTGSEEGSFKTTFKIKVMPD